MTQPNDKTSQSKELEVHTGSSAFGFFHRHQKLIIYTAGIFTLLTFSITGALTSVTDRVFGQRFKGARIEVPGFGEVMITQDDVKAARGISQVRANFYRPMVFPAMSFGDEGGNSQYIDQLAALHALAARAGIEGSDDDVETIIQTAIRTHPNLSSAQEMAFASNINDEALFRKWMRQALRVATFLRLSALGVAQTQDLTVEEILDGGEQVSFEVAYVDSKAFKDALGKKLDDATLKKYLADLDAAKSEKYRKPANRTSIKVAMLESGVFDHKEFLDKEIPKDTKVGEPEVQNYYLRHREDRWKLPKKDEPKEEDPKKDGKDGEKTPKKDGPTKVDEDKNKDVKKKGGEKEDDNGGAGPFDSDQAAGKQGETKTKTDAGKQGETKPKTDAGKQGETKTKTDAGKQDETKTKTDAGKQDETEPKTDAGKQDETSENAAGTQQENPGLIGAADQDTGYKKLDKALQDRIREQIYAEIVLAAWQVELDKAMAKHMEDVVNSMTAAEIAVEDAREAKAEAETELDKKPDDEDLKKKVAAAEKKIETAEAVSKAAKKAEDAQRKAFDFEAILTKLVGKRKGLKLIAVKEMKDAEGLRDIPEVGKWKDSHLPSGMSLAGEVYYGKVQSTDKGSFVFQVTDIEERQFKKFEDIKEDLETDYLTSKAEDETKTKKESFEKALERLARAKLKDEIVKIEKEGKEAIAKEFDEWKAELEAKIAADDKLLATLDKSLRSYKGRKKLRDGHKAELDKADEKKKSFTEETDKKTEEAIDEKLAEVHKDVLVAAAKEAKMVVETIGPFPRTLQSLPRFEHNHPNVVKALFGDTEISKYDVDDTTALKEDLLNEVMFMAACRKVEEGKIGQISRRQWLSLRDGALTGTSFAGAQMELALDQSFTLDALKAGFGWAAPRSLGDEADRDASKTKPDGGKGEKGEKGTKSKGDGQKKG